MIYNKLRQILKLVLNEYPIASFIYTQKDDKLYNISPYRFYKTPKHAISDFKQYCLENRAKKVNRYEYRVDDMIYELAVHSIDMLSLDYFFSDLKNINYIHLVMYIENGVLCYSKHSYFYKKISRTKYKIVNEKGQYKIVNNKINPITQIDNLFSKK